MFLRAYQYFLTNGLAARPIHVSDFDYSKFVETLPERFSQRIPPRPQIEMREVIRQLPSGWGFDVDGDILLLDSPSHKFCHVFPTTDAVETLDYIEQVVYDEGNFLDLRPYQKAP